MTEPKAVEPATKELPPLSLEQLHPKERIERTVKCCVCGWHTPGVPQSDLHASLATILSLQTELAAERARVEELEREEHSSHEWSTVANWRSQQVEAARKAGMEFTEPGTSCRNVRAEAAESQLSALRDRQARSVLRKMRYRRMAG